MKNSSNIVSDKPISFGETVFLEHLDFPTWIVQVDSVDEGSLYEGGRYALKQVRILQHIRNCMLRVTYKRHRCTGLMRTFSSVERLVGKVVLHRIDKDGIHIPSLLLLELIPCHHVPIAHKS